MSESRDANDPRDAMRQMNKETRAELERAEAGQTGGQEHATPPERESPAVERAEEEQGEEIDRVTAEQSDADALRVPRGDPVIGGGGNVASGVPYRAEEDGEDGRGQS